MVSVIIPVYNVESYLRECLDSVIAQTYKDIEIIVVNDGSTDGCGVICDEYARMDARILVIHQSNQGLSAARNAGLDIASGEYVTFVDSDDYVHPDIIENLLAQSKAHDADMSISSFEILDAKNRKNPLLHDGDIEVFECDDKMAAFIRDRKFGNVVWARLYKRSLFSELRFPIGMYYEDVCVTHLLVHAANRIVLMGYCGYVYRNRPGSITHMGFTPKHFDLIESHSEQADFIRSHYPSLEMYALRALIDSCINMLLMLASTDYTDRRMTNRIQKLIREHLRTYFKCSPSYKLKTVALLAYVNVSLARFALKCYKKLFRR